LGITQDIKLTKYEMIIASNLVSFLALVDFVGPILEVNYFSPSVSLSYTYIIDFELMSQLNKSSILANHWFTIGTQCLSTNCTDTMV
jgi:hypothetical protein